VPLCVGDPLSQAYASCDIFVMPSDTETLGFVAMEALASGLPVVGVNAGGLPDIIEHDMNGYLADNADNMTSFSQYVRLLVASPSLRQRLSEAAIRWSANWSWDNASVDLRNHLYTKAIALFKSKSFHSKYILDIEKEIMGK
jgi:sulfoquinovosyltransferase